MIDERHKTAAIGVFLACAILAVGALVIGQLESAVIAGLCALVLPAVILWATAGSLLGALALYALGWACLLYTSPSPRD